MLRQLKIFVPFKIPKSHLIETCIDNEPTENQIAELKTYNIINDNFNVKEDERIVNNFHDLRKVKTYEYVYKLSNFKLHKFSESSLASKCSKAVYYKKLY